MRIIVHVLILLFGAVVLLFPRYIVSMHEKDLADRYGLKKSLSHHAYISAYRIAGALIAGYALYVLIAD